MRKRNLISFIILLFSMQFFCAGMEMNIVHFSLAGNTVAFDLVITGGKNEASVLTSIHDIRYTVKKNEIAIYAAVLEPPEFVTIEYPYVEGYELITADVQLHIELPITKTSIDEWFGDQKMIPNLSSVSQVTVFIGFIDSLEAPYQPLGYEDPVYHEIFYSYFEKLGYHLDTAAFLFEKNNEFGGTFLSYERYLYILENQKLCPFTFYIDR